MEALEAIYNRISVRQFTDEPISEEDLKLILKAGMSGPSCANKKDWAFIVVRDKEMLNKMADGNGRPSGPLRGATIGIMVCGDLEKSLTGAKDYWIEDASIAAQNMILAAFSLDIGSVWLGTYPQMERVENQSKLFNLPETIVPLGIIAFGHFDKQAQKVKPEIYMSEVVHYEKW